MLLWGVLFVAGLILFGVAYQWIGVWLDAGRFPRPGTLVQVGDGVKVHAYARGRADGPVVVCEAGVSATSLSWERVAPLLEGHCRVVTYDRAGLGWSPWAKREAKASTLAGELIGVVEKFKGSGKVVVVGHSFGGMLAVMAGLKRPDLVGAMVLVDPLAPGEFCNASAADKARVGYGVALAKRGVWLSRVGFVRLSLDLLMAGATSIAKFAAKISSGKGASVPARLIGEVQKLPRELWPVVKSHWSHTKSFRAMVSHLSHVIESCEEAAAVMGPIEQPVIVLTASKVEPKRLEGHREYVRLARQGEQIIAEGSGHWILFDEPEVVARAVERAIELSQEA